MRDRSYQGLKDATLFGLLSDKSAVYFNSEKSIGIGFSTLAAWLTQSLHVCFRMQMSCDVTSGWKTPCGRRSIPIFRIFGLKLLSAFSRLDNKRGGIL